MGEGWVDMEIRRRKLDDGRLELSFVGTEEELSHELSMLVEDDSAETSDEGDENLLKPQYCCTCGDGKRKTIKASSSFSAAAKCAERCKGPFSVGRGSCES